MHIASILVSLLLALAGAASGAPAGDKVIANHPIKTKHSSATSTPQGLTVAQVRAAYGLPSVGGTGTIALVDAYDYPTAASDLNAASTKLLGTGFPTCASNTQTKCFEKHLLANHISADSGWALESALDTQWAHAIAPGAKILLVEARSASISDLLSAVSYARSRSDVVAVSMSWGAGEFSSEASYDSYFTSPTASFFASTGDNGHGVSWPAVSRNVTAVGGTTLDLTGNTVTSELAWNGSGGGISLYEPKPSYQTNIPSTTHRSVPDVSYNADPATGVPVYDTTRYSGSAGWWTVGGTSAGAPQWAAIHSLGLTVTNAHLYADSAATHYRDISSGTNGTCGAVCRATSGYDFVTGLGSPLTTSF